MKELDTAEKRVDTGREHIRRGDFEYLPGSSVEGDTDVTEGEYPRCKMNKAFCSCGAIAELDSRAIGVKRGLGKEIECADCRNKRIAREMEELRWIYSDEEEDWLYG
ncbi:MAG: hypothetical protein ACLFUV_06210 [Methanomassiliicoccales archaeon]